MAEARAELLEHSGGTLLRLKGAIDEQFDASVFRGLSGVVIIDLDQITRITSFGVSQWLAGLDLLRDTVHYYGFIKCHPPVLSQFNLIHAFVGRGELISFYMPFACPGCSKYREVLVDLRRDYHIVESFKVTEPRCECGVTMEFDDVPELYLQHASEAPQPSPPALANRLIDVERTGEKEPFRARKHVDGGVTGIWLSGHLPTRQHVKRLHHGLDGHVVLVLKKLSGAEDTALPGIVALAAVPEADVYLARVPTWLAARLPDLFASARARVLSTAVAATCPTCHGQVTVEVPASALVDSIAPLGGLCPECGATLQLAAPADLRALGPHLCASPPPQVADYLNKWQRESSFLGGEQRRSGESTNSGSVIMGRYRVSRSLGVGGMGEVMLAQQVGPGGFERSVVLKRIRPDRLGDPQAVSQFVEEAKLTARLDHPNIVRLLDFAESAGEYILALELVNGLDLAKTLDQMKRHELVLPIGLAMRICMELCLALEAAHDTHDEQGRPARIIHRDVSPSNVLLSRTGIVKLTDFGIAKATSSPDATSPGSLKGKVRYIAPEVISGDPRRNHPRLDVYGAGMILYSCVMGRPCYSGASEAVILKRISDGDRPSLRAGRSEVSEELDAVFKKATERDLELRYQAASEMRRDLEALMRKVDGPVERADLKLWIDNLFEVSGIEGTETLFTPGSTKTPSTSGVTKVTGDN